MNDSSELNKFETNVLWDELKMYELKKNMRRENDQSFIKTLYNISIWWYDWRRYTMT